MTTALRARNLVAIHDHDVICHTVHKPAVLQQYAEHRYDSDNQYRSAAGLRCRGDEQDVELATVIYNAFRERYHKLAGGALGLDSSNDLTEFRQRMSQEELNCALQPD